MDTHDLVVVGAGLCGLIAARDSAKLGSRVKIVEASGRAGGQVWCIDHVGINQTIAVGAEWLNSVKHERLMSEFKRYDINLDEFSFRNEYILYGGRGDKAKLSQRKAFINQLKEDPLYIQVMRLINWDISFISFKDGYFQPDSEHLDMPFIQYITERLQVPATSPIYEFIKTRVYHLTGGNSNTQSALGVLYIISGFRSAENAFSIETELLQRYPNALKHYLIALLHEIHQLNIEIIYNKPVIGIFKQEILVKPSKIPNYDCPALLDHKKTVVIKCADKEEINTRSVILAIPLKCIPSIRFKPELSISLKQAAERCNASADFLKIYVFAGGISQDIGRLSTIQYECAENYTVAKHHLYKKMHDEKIPLNVNNILSTVSTNNTTNCNRNRHPLARNNNHNRSINNEEERINHTLICTSGSRYELMRNITKKLRQIYPVIELPGDNLLDTPLGSRPTTASTDYQYQFTTQVQVVYTSNNRSRGSRVGTPAGIVKPVTSKLQHQLARLPSTEDEEMIAVPPVVDVNTSAYITTHNGSVLYHDFLNDVCIRGTWFTLRAGTASLHAQAVQAAKMPWHYTVRTMRNTVATIAVESREEDTRAIDIKATTTTTTNTATTTTTTTATTTTTGTEPSTANSSEYKEDLSLILAGSELHPEWTGWMEGAVLSGALAAKRLHSYLFPPMVPRNFVKRVPISLPALETAEKKKPALPMRSPSLDRQRSRRIL